LDELGAEPLGRVKGGIAADAIGPDVDAIALGADEPAGALGSGFVDPGGTDGCAECTSDVAGAGGVNEIGGAAGGGVTRAGGVRSNGCANGCVETGADRSGGNGCTDTGGDGVGGTVIGCSAGPVGGGDIGSAIATTGPGDVGSPVIGKIRACPTRIR
jgi:hypothetical protein